MKHKIATLTATMAMLFNAITMPVMAQTTPNDGTTTQLEEDGTATTTQNNDGTNWWWVLPLLAIPLVWMMTRKNEDRERPRSDARTGKARFEGDM